MFFFPGGKGKTREVKAAGILGLSVTPYKKKKEKTERTPDRWLHCTHSLVTIFVAMLNFFPVCVFILEKNTLIYL